MWCINRRDIILHVQLVLLIRFTVKAFVVCRSLVEQINTTLLHFLVIARLNWCTKVTDLTNYIQ